MKNCFDLLVCLPWFEFEHALFWRKMPPLLKVAAENWVKIYNINVAYPDKVFCNYLGIPKVPLGRSEAFLLVRAICETQPSSFHWLSSSIFPCLSVPHR